MTVSSTTMRARYNGDGANDTFALPSSEYLDTTSYWKVYIRDENVSPVTETLKTESTHYDITGSNVVFKAGNIPASGEKVLVIRILPLTQALDLLTNGDFPSKDVEDRFDFVTMLIQQLAEELDRSAKFPITYNSTDLPLPEPTAGQYLKWNADADGLENDSSVSSNAARSGSVALSDTDTSKAVTFATAMADADYAVLAVLVNTTDSSVSFQPITITAKSTTGFTAKWNAPISGSNYSLDYIVRAND